jgi:hypothetical protein
MFSLGGGGRANNTTQGGRANGNIGATMGQRRNLGGSMSNDWDDASAPLRDDVSAPNVGVWFGVLTGEHAIGDPATANNVFTLVGGGGANNTVTLTPPTEIIKWTKEETQNATPQSNRPATQTETPYSGMTAAICRGGLGTVASITQDLDWQQSVVGDTGKISQWKDVMGGLQHFKAYMFIKQGSCFATVVHSPMKFPAINSATAHLQGRVIGFVGDRTATREPTPILLPTNKTWQWVKETVFTDSTALIKHLDENQARVGTLWKGEGADEATKLELHAH